MAITDKYYTILTNIGKAKIANAAGLGTKINFVTMKVGDGGGTLYDPTESQLDLVHTVWQGAITHVEIDADNTNWINIEVLIPPADGGFFIREYGIFDADGNMLAIAKCAETYKPLPADGATKEITMKMVLAISNTSSITLKIDPTVIFAKKSEVEVVQSQVNTIATEIQNARKGKANLKEKIDEIDTSLSDMGKDQIYYCGATSGTNTYTVTNSKITAYVDGLTVRVKIGTASTGASTLNINGFGAKAILDTLGNPIVIGGLKAGLPYQLCYNGANFIVLGKGGGGNVTADKMLSGITATGDSGPVVGNIPSKAAQTYTPGTTNQAIAANQYLGDIQTILGDADLISANIKAGANIFNVTGKASVVDTADALSTAAQILSGASAYVNGLKIIGTATIESLGGKQYASGSTLLIKNSNIVSYGKAWGFEISSMGLSFTPSIILIYTPGYGTSLWNTKTGNSIAYNYNMSRRDVVTSAYTYIPHIIYGTNGTTGVDIVVNLTATWYAWE